MALISTSLMKHVNTHPAVHATRDASQKAAHHVAGRFVFRPAQAAMALVLNRAAPPNRSELPLNGPS